MIIEQNQYTKSRYKLYINVDSDQEYRDTTSRFVLSLDATLTSKDMQMQGCFGGYTNKPFKITGHAAVIEFPGIDYHNTSVTALDPTVPGNLSYIDGCSNSVVIGPPRNGDACVNYLYFPENINQTMHTHPSMRIGLVVDGYGTAHLPDKVIPLKSGDVFLLERHVLHNFSTTSSTMSILVFHPDSESGPTDEFNPMKSRTYLQK